MRFEIEIARALGVAALVARLGFALFYNAHQEKNKPRAGEESLALFLAARLGKESVRKQALTRLSAGLDLRTAAVLTP